MEFSEKWQKRVDDYASKYAAEYAEKEGIKQTIHSCKRLNASFDQAVEQIMDSYNLSREEALEAVKKQSDTV